MSPPEVLCPRCGDHLDRDGMCFGENPAAPHAPVTVELNDDAPWQYPGAITLDGDLITRPWRYK